MAWNKGLVLLQQGRYAEGWPLYEKRWLVKRSIRKPRHAQPEWTAGVPPAGQTILLQAEQGFGDTIQFARYAMLLQQRGATVILEAQRELLRLLASLPGVSQLVEKGAPLPAFDWHASLGGLPWAFNTTLQDMHSPHRYLAADPELLARWRGRLGPAGAPLVGIAWRSSPIDPGRDVPLEGLLSVLPPGLRYVSLHKDLHADDLRLLADNPHVLHLDGEIADFADTAALCELMDLVVSVDTCTAHLAGALGKQVWILLKHVPDWRWLLDRPDSPWYPSARLLRQQAHDRWEDVLAEMGRRLAALQRAAAPH